MSRYTKKMLDSDIEAINKSLVGTGSYILAQGRNGYTGLDEYKGERINVGGPCEDPEHSNAKPRVGTSTCCNLLRRKGADLDFDGNGGSVDHGEHVGTNVADCPFEFSVAHPWIARERVVDLDFHSAMGV